MQTYIVNLQSEVFKTFRCTKAANSLDIDAESKSKHNLQISADLKSKFNVGLIVGSSGSGKTTLAKKIFGENCFDLNLDMSKPIIDLFPESMTYEECAETLSGVGLTSVPCWIRPMYTLSNGQRARAEAAILMTRETDQITCIDEWTSVVDRTVAKVMSYCIQKWARRNNKKIILNSCHYDVIEWLNPDFIIDCNKASYIDRRAMVGTFKRTDQLRFDIKECDRKPWKYFSKYHYLNSNLPAGKNYFFGLYHDGEQIGFQCYTAYLPGRMEIQYSNRVVIHPDYCGFGLGIKFINETARIMSSRGFKIRATFSSIALYKARVKDPLWRLISSEVPLKSDVAHLERGKNSKKDTTRKKVRVFRFEYIGA